MNIIFRVNTTMNNEINTTMYVSVCIYVCMYVCMYVRYVCIHIAVDDFKCVYIIYINYVYFKSVFYAFV